MVSLFSSALLILNLRCQCDSYGRILKEIAGSEEPADAEVVNVEVALDGDGSGDKAFTAMGLAKTIGTVCFAFS